MSVAGGTVLLVEDFDDDVFAFKWALKKADVTLPVQVATDGQRAIDYLSGFGAYADREAHPLPSLVFLDLKLPYVSGMEVLAWIRQRPELDSVPVVILSGSDEARDHEQAASLGAADYVVKPASPADLRRILENL